MGKNERNGGTVRRLSFFSFPTARKRTGLPGTWGVGGLTTFFMESTHLKELVDVLRSVDTSLQMLANSKTGSLTTAFISKKALAARLGVQPVAVDKLVYQGITSGGTSGLVEGRHYCKLDPSENNISNFLFDSAKVLSDAWKNFTGY